MKQLSVDIETYSDINIKKAGLYKYVQSQSFQILLAAYAYDDGPVQQIDLASGEQLPIEIIQALMNPDITKKAWNATFEWYCLSKYLHTHEPIKWLSQWHDTMVEALYTGFPAGLDGAGAAIGLSDDRKKLATGKALIKYFCVPCAPTSRNGNRDRNLPQHDTDRWQLFKEYNRQDVVTERAIGQMVSRYPVPESEWALWRLDQQINLRGVCMDKQLISGAQYCSAAENKLLLEEAATLAAIDNPKSIKQLMSWINEETDENIDDLKKSTVSDLIKNTDDATLRRMLEIRQQTGKTSVKKYDAMEAVMCNDGKVRGLLQFYGAQRTGRWAGRLVQVQNLPQNHLQALELARNLTKAKNLDMIRFMFGSIPDTLSQLIRTAFVPSPGNIFTVADFHAIEACVIAWEAGETWRQEIFATHGKIYEASASAMFSVPIERIAKGNPEYALRQKGKVAELALGYQGSSGALIAMGALKQGLTEAELPDIVRRWRKASPRIVDLWYSYERAAIDSIKTGRINVVRYVAFAREIDKENGRDFLTIQLPSGRKLYYDHPVITQGEHGEHIQYRGTHQKTHKWVLLDTYGGKLVENVTQAIARDCLAIAMERIAAAGFKIVFHIHDEVICDTPSSEANPLERMTDIMAQPIVWAPGLALRADGFTTDFYKKD